MKKRLLSVLLLVMVFSFVFASETILEVNSKGEVREREVTPENDWQNITDHAKLKAYENPGQEIPLDLSKTQFKRVDFFHYRNLKEYSRVVEFSDGHFKIRHRQDVQYQDQEPKFIWYVLWVLISMVLMIILDIILLFIADDVATLVFVLVVVLLSVAVATGLALAVATTFVFVLLSVDVLLGIAELFALVFSNDRRTFVIFNIIFYTLMITALFV